MALALSGQLESQSALRSTSLTFNENLTSVDMTYSYSTVADYAERNGWRENSVRLGGLLDRVRTDSDIAGYYDSLANLNDTQLAQALDRLGAGELAADAQTLALWSPWRRTHARLYEKMEDVNYCCERPCERQFWLEGSYTGDNVSSSGSAVGYHQRRGTFMIGVDRQLACNFAAGLMFAYGQPRAYNRLARIEGDDYTVGVYAQIHPRDFLRVNLFGGYGHQSFDYTNRLSGFDASYDGDTVYGSVEFVRPVYYDSCLTFLPLFAVDYQQTWVEGFTDRSSGQPDVRYDSESMFQALARLGLNARFNWNERVNLTARFQYAYNFGDTRGELTTSFADAPGRSTMLRGASLGENIGNLGFGGEVLLGHDGSWKFYAEYDVFVSDHATSQTGFFGVEKKW